MAGMAFAKAFNPENITSSFKNTGIFSYNRNIFTEDEFLPAAVTDIALATENADNQQAIVVSNQPHDQDVLTNPHLWRNQKPQLLLEKNLGNKNL